MKKLLFLLPLLMILFSCYTTPSSTVAPGVDFSQYTHAAIGSDLDGGAVLYDSQMKLQNSLTSCGYQIIGDTRIGTLSQGDQEKTFIITMGMTSTSYESVCVINITDHMSGFLMASCKGAFGLGWDIEDDQRHAIDKAIVQMENVIRR